VIDPVITPVGFGSSIGGSSPPSQLAKKKEAMRRRAIGMNKEYFNSFSLNMINGKDAIKRVVLRKKKSCNSAGSSFVLVI